MLAVLTDALRLWAAGGAFFAFLLSPSLVAAFYVHVVSKERLRRVVYFLLITCIVEELAKLIAGVVVPLFNDGRVQGLSRSMPIYEGLLGLTWLLWGAASWGIAVYFSPRKSLMMVGGGAWLILSFVVSTATMGAML